MANRARDKVIYIRVDEALKKRFDRIKEQADIREMQISLTIFLMYMTESVWMV